MTSDPIDAIERRTTRRSILKTSLVASTLGIGGTATGLAQTDGATNNETETHTLTVGLIASNSADIVSGDVTVDGRTKTTAPVDGDPAKILTTFELENGTYTVSGESDFQGETWRAKDQAVTIDGADESVSLLLSPPDSDELDDAPATESHSLSVYLVESSDADIVSGDVTVNGTTKTTEPVDGAPTYVQASFELEDGAYTVSAASEYRDEIWRSNNKEITIDGADRTLELYVYPPDSDELEDNPNDEEDTGSDDGSGGGDTGSDGDSAKTDGENADETDGTSQDGADSNADDADETERANDQQQSATADAPDTGCPNEQDK
ncbi:hypothetical protein [Halocatena pleomorpha]|uniref:Uncharacterized protein n=1 Tax=Halocatena pleomorpha TaxID=1785090 RepID=A0A3P3RFM9_9EURY|nr:hypothetical protein [Halocatena pleomorpha]RRJ32326.1 hypothetical protein EIK79_04865 [Halocatena pleomorpha]